MDLALVFVIIGLLLIGALAVLAHTDPKRRIAAMTDDEPSSDRWPIAAADDSASPYLRGATSAARLSGRR